MIVIEKLNMMITCISGQNHHGIQTVQAGWILTIWEKMALLNVIEDLISFNNIEKVL